MEIFLAVIVCALVVKKGAEDIGAVITGHTPPNHTYRMAKMAREERAEERRDRRREQKTPLRFGPGDFFRHWVEDACEDADHWRAERRHTKPERQEAKAQRKAHRKAWVDEWLARKAGMTDAPEADGPVYTATEESKEPQQDARPGPKPAAPKVLKLAPAKTETTENPAPQRASTEGTIPMANGSTEGGLDAHIRWTGAMSGSQTTAKSQVEQVQAVMAQGGVGANTRALVAAIQDNHTQLQTKYAALQKALQQQKRVQEAYVATRGEAGNKRYLMGGR